MEQTSFSDIAIVSCGTMKMELNALKEEGVLDTDHLLFTTPGLHQDIVQLEKQLVSLIDKGKQMAEKIIVVYGGKFCYVNADNPTRADQVKILNSGN